MIRFIRYTFGTIFTMALGFGFTYLVGAFYNISFCLKDWNKDSLFAITVTGAIVSGILGIYYFTATYYKYHTRQVRSR